MPDTALANILAPEAISAFVMAELPKRLALLRSGAAVADFDSLAQQGGDFIKIRQFEFDTTASEVNDGSESTPAYIANYQDVGVVCHRKRVRKVDDVIKAKLGTGDANAVNNEIARQNAEYWANELHIALMAVIKAHFITGGALEATHLNDVSAASGTVKTAGIGNMLATSSKLGDYLGATKLFIGHSLVIKDILTEAAARPGSLAISDISGLQTYMGYQLLADDTVPTSGSSTYKKYWSFVLGQGALSFAIQRAMQVMTELQASYPREILTSTLDFVPHVRGVKWNVTDINPTNATLATANKWLKVAPDDKLIRATALVTNAAA